MPNAGSSPVAPVSKATAISDFSIVNHRSPIAGGVHFASLAIRLEGVEGRQRALIYGGQEARKVLQAQTRGQERPVKTAVGHTSLD